MLRSAILAATVAIGFVQSALAQPVPLYSTSFQSPTYSDGALAPVTVATDTTTPGQDGWLNTNAGLTNPIQVSNSATNGIISLTTSGQDVRHPLSSSVSSGSIFLDAHVTVSAAGSGDYALHLSDAAGTNNFNARVFFKASGAGFVMAFGTGTGTTPTYGTTELPFGTLTHVLARYDFVAGTGNDTGALYINPTTFDGSGDTPYVGATTQGTDAVSLANVAFRQGGGNGVAPTLTVDDVQVFASSAVPEPTSFALVGGVVVAGVVSRLRRKSA
jgi:hypothetical protein